MHRVGLPRPRTDKRTDARLGTMLHVTYQESKTAFTVPITVTQIWKSRALAIISEPFSNGGKTLSTK